ncbi:unnamed protein product [Eretmochelys imbricata]
MRQFWKLLHFTVMTVLVFAISFMSLTTAVSVPSDQIFQYIEEHQNEYVQCNLYGRGASDDKGQVLAVLNAIEALQKHELPVNVKILLEGMEEVGSIGLNMLVEQRNSTFFSDVDYIVVTDTAWLSNKPGITYGTRGNCHFFLEGAMC